MREYNEHRLHSFKCDTNIKKEVKIIRIYKRHGKFRIEELWAETTDTPNIIIIPDSIIQNLKNNSPYGFTGEVKPGSYRINNNNVIIENIHSVYNGEGYATIRIRTTELDYTIKELFNATQDKLNDMHKLGQIDTGMYEICSHFRKLGFKSVFSCNGHNKKQAYIKFSTDTNEQELRALLQDCEFVTIEKSRHGEGNFDYITIYFDFCENNINKLMQTGGIK